MISKNTVRKFCNGNIAEIENYDEAVADKTCTWHCHHRMEIQPDGTRLSRAWMIEHDIYYNLDPCMLIFLTSKEHRKLHMDGHEVSEKNRQNFIERTKNMKHDNFRGHNHSDDTKKKISEKIKGRKLVMVNGRRTYVFPEVK